MMMLVTPQELLESPCVFCKAKENIHIITMEDKNGGASLFLMCKQCGQIFKDKIDKAFCEDWVCF